MIDKDILDFNKVSEIIYPYGTSQKPENPKQTYITTAGSVSNTLQQLIRSREKYLASIKDNPLYIDVDWDDDIVDKLNSISNFSFMITSDTIQVLTHPDEEIIDDDTIF